MARMRVTITGQAGAILRRVEVPGNVAIQKLLAVLPPRLGMPATDTDGEPIRYSLYKPGQTVPLDLDQTLNQTDVADGDFLGIYPAARLAATTETPHDVFISYSAHDKTVADATCAALEAWRIRCWLAPRDVLAGTEYGEAILKAIEDCRAMVLIFSSHANQSPHIRREVERAVSKGKFIVPFRIEDVLPSRSMEYCLGNTHWLDALTPPLEARIIELQTSVARLLGRKSGAHTPEDNRSFRSRGEDGDQSPSGRRPKQKLLELKKIAESGISPKDRTRAIQAVALRGGRAEIPWLRDLVFRTTRKATRAQSVKQIVELGGDEAIRSLKDIAENHNDDGVRGDAVELIPRLDRMSDPEWFKCFLAETPVWQLKYRLLEALAQEGWSNRMDMSIGSTRSFIADLQQMAETEKHPDVRHRLISLVAHLCKNEPWTREWVFRKAMDADEGYYRIHGLAIGLSVWNDDETFIRALDECPKDSTGHDGKMFVAWAREGDWRRYRFHMGGWGPRG